MHAPPVGVQRVCHDVRQLQGRCVQARPCQLLSGAVAPGWCMSLHGVLADVKASKHRNMGTKCREG